MKIYGAYRKEIGRYGLKLEYYITVLYAICHHALLYIGSNIAKENTVTVFRMPFYIR